MGALKKRSFDRAIIVDAKGSYIVAVQWAKGKSPPEINRPKRGQPRVTKEDRKHLLTSADALSMPSEDARWDFMRKVWKPPTLDLWIVDEASGVMLSRKKVWPDSIPDLPDGLVFVDVPPPAALSQKPIFNFDTETWGFAHKVAIIGPDGVVLNVALENPCSNTPDVEIPSGCTKICGKRAGLPFDEAGREISKGCKRQPGGKWITAPRLNEVENGAPDRGSIIARFVHGRKK